MNKLGRRTWKFARVPRLREDVHPRVGQAKVLHQELRQHQWLAQVERTPRHWIVNHFYVGADLRFVYLPPNSPDLNPTEEAFAKVKALLRRAGIRVRP